MTDLVVAGFDPGKTGAFSIVGSVAEVYDLPWNGSDIDFQVIMSHLLPLRDNPALQLHIGIEYQSGFKGQGISSINTLMFGYGQLVGFCLGAQIPFTIVRPLDWKRAMGLPVGADKAASKTLARRLFPQADLGTRADQGRSDALLIAERVRRMLVGS